MGNVSTITRKLYVSASTGSTNDAAHLDVTADMWLLAIVATLTSTSTANADAMSYEISTASQGQWATSDALNVLAYFDTSQAFVTSGLAGTQVNSTSAPLRFFIPRGTRVYVHTSGVKSGGAMTGKFILHLAYA